jgi:hypothetical protein
MIRVVIPHHLRVLAQVGAEVQLDVLARISRFRWSDGPQPHRPVVASAGQRQAVGREGHAKHLAAVAFEGNSRLFLRQVPEGDAPRRLSCR